MVRRLVGTSRIEKYQKTFLRHCRPVLQQMLAVYPRPKTTSTSETMLPKNGCTGLDSGLKKPRLMVLLVLISTDFTWRENNVRSGYCWWSNARHEWHSGIHPVPTGKYASKVAEANADIATAQANDAINRVTLKLSNGAERPDSGLVHRRRQWGDRRRFIYR